METVTAVLNILLPIVLVAVGIALVVFIVELTRTVKVARTTVTDMKEQLAPTLANVETITNDLTPAMAKVDPLVDRVQLTVDALNLEMMRVDEILEDVSEITDTASSATAAVDTITSAPIKAVSNVASRVKTAFGGKTASEESAQLAEQRVAVAQALEDYKAAEEKEAKRAARAQEAEAARQVPAVEAADEAPAAGAGAAEPAETAEPSEPAVEPLGADELFGGAVKPLEPVADEASGTAQASEDE